MWPFTKKEKLIIGAIYIFKPNPKNPFVPDPHKVKIKDIKNNYVLYDFEDNLCTYIGKNESKEISSFQYCYKLYEE